MYCCITHYLKKYASAHLQNYPTRGKEKEKLTGVHVFCQNVTHFTKVFLNLLLKTGTLSPSCGLSVWLRNKSSQVTYVTMVPRMGNETLRPLGVATGNALSVTRV